MIDGNNIAGIRMITDQVQSSVLDNLFCLPKILPLILTRQHVVKTGVYFLQHINLKKKLRFLRLTE